MANSLLVKERKEIALRVSVWGTLAARAWAAGKKGELREALHELRQLGWTLKPPKEPDNESR